MLVRRFKEGGGGQKMKEPEPTTPQPSPKVPAGREWANV